MEQESNSVMAAAHNPYSGNLGNHDTLLQHTHHTLHYSYTQRYSYWCCNSYSTNHYCYCTGCYCYYIGCYIDWNNREKDRYWTRSCSFYRSLLSFEE